MPAISLFVGFFALGAGSMDAYGLSCRCRGERAGAAPSRLVRPHSPLQSNCVVRLPASSTRRTFMFPALVSSLCSITQRTRFAAIWHVSATCGVGKCRQATLLRPSLRRHSSRHVVCTRRPERQDAASDSQSVQLARTRLTATTGGPTCWLSPHDVFPQRSAPACRTIASSLASRSTASSVGIAARASI